MQTVKLRQQGGAMIVTIPRDLAIDLGWSPGTELTVEKKVDSVNLRATEHKPRGRLTVAQLLSQIDESEITELNQSTEGWAEGKKGNEAW
ncbi:AbrB/MazE/SpoVT family DNA-binding domain-containing protein [Shigella flexneri]|nr:AbrB/MazE/SpoVT family DNA-binding domain-containing protein [Shigella flexneri]EFZ4273346.1 AbrB/MazE/SpoVT family DNA-binding domain-containing protein [Shigella flexneri]EJK8456242.1 AbrB/MazE/SpoVT family DNA-binding domain-containing protein [Shigella flexneri]